MFKNCFSQINPIHRAKLRLRASPIGFGRRIWAFWMPLAALLFHASNNTARVGTWFSRRLKIQRWQTTFSNIDAINKIKRNKIFKDKFNLIIITTQTNVHQLNKVQNTN
jgi:hypothetical protein